MFIIDFVTGKLGGMNENCAKVILQENDSNPRAVCTAVLMAGNLLQVPSSKEDVFNFAAKTLASGTLVLVTVKLVDRKASLMVNSEKMVIGAMLIKDIQKALERKQ